MTNTLGWFKFSNSRKFHIIKSDGRSLCGKWLYLGIGPFEPITDKESPDDCASCSRTLELLRCTLKI